MQAENRALKRVAFIARFHHLQSIGVQIDPRARAVIGDHHAGRIVRMFRQHNGRQRRARTRRERRVHDLLLTGRIPRAFE